MAKKGKKRRHHETTSKPSDIVVASLKTNNDDSIESCLAEMAGAVSLPAICAPVQEAEVEEATSSSRYSELCNPSLTSLPISIEMRERITAWNRSMRTWQTTGTYTPGMLPSFDVELSRHFKVQALSTFLLDACMELKMPAFERWLIDSKLEERQKRGSASADPVLSLATVDYQSSQRLLEEIRETGMPRNDAKKLVKDLCHRTDVALREISQQQHLHAGKIPLKKGDRIDVEGSGEPVMTLVYHRKKWKKPFCIKMNSLHYGKLRAMFLRVHNQVGQQQHPVVMTQAGKPTKATHAFHLLLTVLLLRYSSLSGGQLLMDLRGGGMQGAVHGEVFHALNDTFPKGPLFECFGSPLNAYLFSFASAFPNLDWHFGSIGSFFESTIIEGCCEANPPFAPGMMTAMAERIEYNISQADKCKASLTFVVIVPNAGDDGDSDRAAAKRFGGVSLKKMMTGTSCRLHILLSAKEHGYVEGAQHMRPTRYKESLYDTSVIILQSKQARRKSLDNAMLEKKIREAFASRHREEVERRKLEEGDDIEVSGSGSDAADLSK